MRKCKSLRPGVSRIVQKCTIREICLTFQKLSKSSHALKFGFTARQYLNRWQTLTLGTKLATRANKWQIRGNVKPPRGRSWSRSWQLGFFGMYNLPLSYFARISADRASAQSLNPHSCMSLRALLALLSAYLLPSRAG